MTLSECKHGQWYEIVDGLGFIKNETTILYEYLREDNTHFVVGESPYDEMGIVVSMENAKKIIVSELFF